MKFFRRGYEMTLNRVHDTVTIREGDERITLTVNGDAMRIVAGLNRAQEKLKAIDENTPDETVKEAAEYFAAVIFGREQAKTLVDFYAGDPSCVVTVCGQYFKERLAAKISAIQRKQNNAETV